MRPPPRTRAARHAAPSSRRSDAFSARPTAPPPPPPRRRPAAARGTADAPPAPREPGRPRFQRFVTPADAASPLATFARAARLPCGGALLIRPLAPAELAPAAAVLTASFAESMGYPPAARGVLASHIESYLARHANLLPAAAVLGATLVPAEDGRSSDLAALEAAATRGWTDDDDPDRTPSTSFYIPPSGDAALAAAGGGLVASAELSFDAATRSRALGGLDPPRGEPATAYLCNMAVSASARGRGIGGALLDAAHEAAALGGARRVYLHLRLRDADGAAGRLYGKAGYSEVGRDAPLVRVFGRDRRCLLVRDV